MALVNCSRADVQVPTVPWLSGFSQIERAFQDPFGRGWLAERVPGDRLQQEGTNKPGTPDQGSRAVQDRCERGGRRVRIVLGEPQCRQCGPRSAGFLRAADAAIGSQPGMFWFSLNRLVGSYWAFSPRSRAVVLSPYAERTWPGSAVKLT